MSRFMCDAPLCSPILYGHIKRFALSVSQQAARALASSADGCIPLLIPGLPVVHCTLSAMFVGPKRLRLSWQRPVTIGEARREIQRRHQRCLLEWLHDQFLSGVHPETLFELFAA